MSVIFATAGLSCVASAHAELADVGNDGTPANAASSPVSVSADGRYVLFSSSATNLVAGSPAGIQGYLRDRAAGTTTLPIADHLPIAMTPDARYVLVSKNGLFVFDRQTQGFERVDVSTAGVPASSPGSATAGAISANGRYVVFSSTAPDLVAGDANGARDVFLRDRQSGTTTRVSEAVGGSAGSGDSVSASISADGSVVSFSSEADDLVAGDENDDADLFARPLWSATQLVSVDSAGLQDASAPPTQCTQSMLSNDGRFVAFSCGAPNLAPPSLRNDQRADHAYVRDRVAGTTVRADVDGSGTVLSADGQLLTPSVAGDGRRAAFWSNATFPGRIVLWDAVPTGRARVLDVRGQAPLLSHDGLTLIYQDIPTAASTAHVGVLALAAPVADTAAPAISCAVPDQAWHAADVALACTATDTGSGLSDGADASFALSTSTVPGAETATASTSSRLVCDLAGNCATAGPLGPIRIDRRSPTASCDGVPAVGARLELDVIASCAVTDAGSGTASGADRIVLRTTVAGGLTDPAATTPSQAACDQVGNCSTVGPFGPFSIDRLAAPPSERDSDGDGLDDATDPCPLTAGACAPDETVPEPSADERAASVKAAAGAALATCAAPGRPAALDRIATAAKKRAGMAAGDAVRTLARATCSASLSAAAASLQDRTTARAATTQTTDLSPYLPQARDVSADIARELKRCRKQRCKTIVAAAADAAQSATRVSTDAIALAVARKRLRLARSSGDAQAKVVQAALVRVYEGSLSAAQDARAAEYKTFGKATAGAGVNTSLPAAPQESAQGALTKGSGVPGQARQDLQAAGLDGTDVTAAIVQSHINADQPTVTAASARKPATKSRRKIASALAYDAVARVVIVLAARRELTFTTTGRLLNALDDARDACTSADRDTALQRFAAAAKGTKAAAFVDTSVRLLQANIALTPRCR